MYAIVCACIVERSKKNSQNIVSTLPKPVIKLDGVLVPLAVINAPPFLDECDLKPGFTVSKRFVRAFWGPVKFSLSDQTPSLTFSSFCGTLTTTQKVIAF